MSCPSKKLIKTGKIPHQVFWGEPTFHDNVDGNNVHVFSSQRNGQYFSRGKHEIKYTARDQSLNYVECKFTVQVECKLRFRNNYQTKLFSIQILALRDTSLLFENHAAAHSHDLQNIFDY